VRPGARPRQEYALFGPRFTWHMVGMLNRIDVYFLLSFFGEHNFSARVLSMNLQTHFINPVYVGPDGRITTSVLHLCQSINPRQKPLAFLTDEIMTRFSEIDRKIYSCMTLSEGY
jgi:hypothetical protein